MSFPLDIFKPRKVKNLKKVSSILSKMFDMYLWCLPWMNNEYFFMLDEQKFSPDFVSWSTLTSSKAVILLTSKFTKRQLSISLLVS